MNLQTAFLERDDVGLNRIGIHVGVIF
jgi:hypothetical protein